MSESRVIDGNSLPQLRTLLWAKGRMAWHWVASVRTESKLKVSFVSICAMGLLLGGFLFAWGGLYLLRDLGERNLGVENGINLTDLVFERLLSVMSLTVFMMLIVSNVLVCFATVYRSREVPFLVQAPLSGAKFFLSRFWESVSFSSWAVLFLGAPVLLAYGLVREAPVMFYLAALLFFVPFVLIPAGIGAVITTVLVRIAAGRSRPHVVLGFGALLTALYLLFRRGMAPDFSTVDSVQGVLALMAQTQSPFLPSHWFSHGLLLASHGQPAESLFYWLLLLANAALVVWLATLASERFFYEGFTRLRSSDEQKTRTQARGVLARLETFLPVSEPWRSLVAKDLRLFWRDPAQWSQFLIFFGLMAFYLANLESEGLFSKPPWRAWMALLNMAATLLILATLTTRFVFPLISLEGRRFWVLGLAPLSMKRLLLQKFLLSLITTSVITLGLAGLSAYRLGLERFEVLLSVFSVGITTFALSGLAVGLGSLYPNFEEDNPSRITSGMGGTLNFILSLVFIAVVTAGQAFLLQWQRVGEASQAATPGVLAGLFVFALAAGLVPLRLGLRNLETAEF